MQDDPRKNLQWLQQQLLEEEGFTPGFQQEGPSGREPEPELLRRPRTGTTRGQRAEQAYLKAHFDESAAVLTKTRKQLRREEKQRKLEKKKSNVNRKLADLVILAVLECIGILWLLGWWLQ